MAIEKRSAADQGLMKSDTWNEIVKNAEKKPNEKDQIQLLAEGLKGELEGKKFATQAINAVEEIVGKKDVTTVDKFYAEVKNNIFIKKALGIK